MTNHYQYVIVMLVGKDQPVNAKILKINARSKLTDRCKLAWVEASAIVKPVVGLANAMKTSKGHTVNVLQRPVQRQTCAPCCNPVSNLNLSR